MLPNIISVDPLYSDYSEFQQALKDCANLNKIHYAQVLQQAAETDHEVAKFCDAVQTAIDDLDSAKYVYHTPYLSSVIMAWISGLQRGLEWISLGAESTCLRFFSNTSDFFKDLNLEYPAYREKDRHHFYTCIDKTMYVIPVQFLAESARAGQRVADCLPENTIPHLFTRVDESLLHKVSEHIEDSLSLINELSRDAYKLLKKNIHFLHVGLYRFSKNSFGTRIDYPGTVIMGIFFERIEKRDLIPTAAEFYHEHCHLKLSIFTLSRQISFPPAADLISPFKNENRNFETVLHTVYTISMECYVRLLLMKKENGHERVRTLCFLAAVGYRLDLLQESLAQNKAISICKEFEQICDLCKFVLKNIFALVTTSAHDLQQELEKEKQEVLDRHVWDIGQFLCRGVSISDPHLCNVKKYKNKVSFSYRGINHQAVLRKKLLSTNGNYGLHVAEKILSRPQKLALS